MPVPKKRHSNTRTRTRRANWKLKPMNFADCPQCHSKILSHHACPVCGTYQGRMVLKIETEEKKKSAKGKAPADKAPAGKEENPKS
ncbi:MAG: 50S ribosomal protein L32 [bacterium]